MLSFPVNTLPRLHRRPTGEWLLIAIFLATLPLVNPYVRGDGHGYYAYIRSAVIDGDLRFENEYRHGDPAFLTVAFDQSGRVRPEMVMPTTYVRNQWAVGPSLLWAPFFVAAHGLVWILNGLGSHIPADGYSLPYRGLCALGTALYSWIGLRLAYGMAAGTVGSSAALAATVGIWFGSSLPAYMYFLPFHAHALAAFSVSLFLWYWLRTRRLRRLKQWGVWGAVGGLMTMVYHLNAVFLLIPLVELITGGSEQGVQAPGAGSTRHEGRLFVAPTFRSACSRVVQGTVFAGAALLAVTPHLAIKWIVHGSPLVTGYGDRFFWSSPRLWQVGLAAEHGMFVWTPALLGAVVGLLLLWRRERWLAGPLLAVFGVFYYAVASYQNWHGQSAFGSRFFVSFTPVFILGLATLVDEGQASLRCVFRQRRVDIRGWPMGHRSIPFVLPMLAVLILWNVGFMFQWGTNMVPNRGPVDLAVVARNQVTVVPSRMAGFLMRYVTGRERLVRDLEQEDLREWKTYDVRR